MSEALTNQWVELPVLLGFLIPITLVDMRAKRIPDLLVLPAIGVFLGKRLLFGENPLHVLLMQGAVGFAFILFLHALSRGKIGLGDAKLSALLAIVLGVKGWLLVLFIASGSGLFYGILKLKYGGMERNEKIPYAPFLSLGTLISFIMITCRFV